MFYSGEVTSLPPFSNTPTQEAINSEPDVEIVKEEEVVEIPAEIPAGGVKGLKKRTPAKKKRKKVAKKEVKQRKPAVKKRKVGRKLSLGPGKLLNPKTRIIY